MTSLYIEGELQENGKLLVSLESATCLALVCFISPPLTVFVIPTRSDSDNSPDILFTSPPKLTLSFLNNLPLPAALCRPPVVTLDDGISSVAGLSAVLRKVMLVIFCWLKRWSVLLYLLTSLTIVNVIPVI